MGDSQCLPIPPAVFYGALIAIPFFAIMKSPGKLINYPQNVLEKSLNNVFKILYETCLGTGAINKTLARKFWTKLSEETFLQYHTN